MWLMWTKSAQARSASACPGCRGLMSTSIRPTVGCPVSRPWPGRGVRRKWWPVTPSEVVGAVNPLVTSYTPSSENSGSLRGRSVRSRHAFSHQVARSTPPPRRTSSTRVRAYCSASTSLISRYRPAVSRSSTVGILSARFRAEPEQRARVVARHATDRVLFDAIGEERVGEVLESRRRPNVRLLPVVGRQRAPLGSDRAHAGGDLARRPGGECSTAGERAQLDRGAEVRQLDALVDGEVRSRQFLHRVGDEHVPAPAVLLRNLAVLEPGHVAGGEDRVVVGDEVEDGVRVRRQRSFIVDDGKAGAGDAEGFSDAVQLVLPARQGREPDDLRSDAECRLHRRRVDATDLPVAADPAEDAHAVHDAVYDGCQRRRRVVVRLQDDGGVPGAGSVACGVERVDRAFAMRVRPEVAVQVGSAGEIDRCGHQSSRRKPIFIVTWKCPTSPPLIQPRISVTSNQSRLRNVSLARETPFRTACWRLSVEVPTTSVTRY